MICPSCGRRTYKDEAVCPKCGAAMPRRSSGYAPKPALPEDYEFETVKSTGMGNVVRKKEPELPYLTTQENHEYVTPATAPKKEPPPAPKKENKPKKQPAQEAPLPVAQAPKDDFDRTLSFKEAKRTPAGDTAAVREYDRIHRSLSSEAARDDGTKVILDRPPEGYIYVKMPIADADKLKNRKKLPTSLIVVISSVFCAMIAVIVILLATTGKSVSAAPIIGKWEGVIDPSALGITALANQQRMETTWKFDSDGELSLVAGGMYTLEGEYELPEGEEDNERVIMTIDAFGKRVTVKANYEVKGDELYLTLDGQEDLPCVLTKK